MVLIQHLQQQSIETVDYESVQLPKPPVTEKWVAVHTLSNTSSARASTATNSISDYGDVTPTVLLASASRDRLVNVFDATDQTTALQTRYDNLHSEQHQYPLLQTLDSHTSSVTAVKFSKVTITEPI
jgi:WD40 repeat protein